MITEQDLQAAIAECQGERNPNANTCIKLAAFYTIRRELFGNPEQLTAGTETAKQLTEAAKSFQKSAEQFVNQSAYSYAPPPEEVETTIDYQSDTDFGRLIDGRKASEIWPVVDELVSEAVQATNPRLYDAFLRKIQS